MKLYIAGNTFNKNWTKLLEEIGSQRGLVSYWDILSMDKYDEFDYYRERDLFMDSGAFSAFTKGVTIPVEDYCDFIEKYDLQVYSNLDDIVDHTRTAKNQQHMEARGLKPIPVFHLNEPYEVLEDMLKKGYPFIALGVAGTQGSKVCDLFLYESFKIIARYWPVKIHGFGITTQKYLERYPFYSSDSTSAIMGAGMGRVFHWKNGRLKSGTYRDERCGRKLPSTVDMGSTQHMNRRIHNVKQHLRLERQITSLWKQRGVIWDD